MTPYRSDSTFCGILVFFFESIIRFILCCVSTTSISKITFFFSCLQVEVKKFCVFLPKSHLQMSEPCVNIPQNLHRLARSRSLPDTIVVCLPHVTIHSAGHKSVSFLQEIPIITMEGSLVGKLAPQTADNKISKI